MIASIQIALVAAAALAAPAGTAGEQVTVRAAELPRADLAREFDQGWRLPPRSPGSPGLVPALEALLAEDFAVELDGATLSTFGDLILASEELERGERKAWMQRLERAAPGAFARHADVLRQLLADDELRSKRWDANDDTDRDGFLMARSWALEQPLPGPWGKIKVDVGIEQGAAFVRSDLSTFKAVENDFRLYSQHRGARYDWIYPAADRYFRCGEGPEAVNTSLIVFRCDLPFPLSNYDCRLHVMNRLDASSRLVTDIYSTSRDFYFMAGQDLFLPVRAGDRAPVGFVVVRDFGFDLDGVPDKRKHRTGALRRTLGNLKLESERRSAAGTPGRELGDIDGAVPEFVMYGVRD